MQEKQRRCYRHWSRNSPVAPWRAHTEAEIWRRAGKISCQSSFFPVGLQLMEEPTPEQRRGIRWKKRPRGSATDWLCPSLCLTVLVGWVAGSERGEVEPGRGRENMLFCFIAHLCFSLPESMFIGNTLNSFSPSQGCFTHKVIGVQFL